MALTKKELDILVGLLSKVERPYPEKLFQALCAYTLTAPVEIIPITRNGKVLLFRRSPIDPVFANMWHIPGSIQLKGDTVRTTLSRIFNQELKRVVASAPKFIGFDDIMKGTGPKENRRGQERPLIFRVWVKEKKLQRKWKIFFFKQITEGRNTTS